MDERIQNILDNVQKTAYDAADTATDAARSVSKKASQLLSVGKMNVALMNLKTEVAAQLQEVGEMVYATHIGNPTDSDLLLQKLQVIDGLNAQINALNVEIQNARNVRITVCPYCGATAKAGDQFCRNCGGKL